MVLAAWLRRIPAALTEADAHLGLANRLAAPFARRVFLAYGVDGGSRRATAWSAGPCPPSISASRGPRLAPARPAGRRAGAGVLRRARRRAQPERASPSAPTRRAGRRCCTSPASATTSGCGRSSTGPTTSSSPHTDEFGAALAAADLAVSRAGGTVWELAAAGTPSILVPYPHATGDHQTLNARWFADRGGAVVVADAELDARCRRSSTSCSPTPERLAAMREAMLAAARPDAAAEIADELIALARA